MGNALSGEDAQRLGNAVRDACVQIALEAYERAAMDGVCTEGAWEAAVDAMRSLDVTVLLRLMGERGLRE